MSEAEIPQMDPAAEAIAAPADESPIIHPKAPPIESRFLYVDVAALRAKQLRRGALPRLEEGDSNVAYTRAIPLKAERVAMEEVRRGLVLYEVPATKGAE